MPEKPVPGTPKHVPHNRELSTEQPRFRPPGGKPPLPLTSSFSPQAKKQKEN